MATHPLDPLCEHEITIATEVINKLANLDSSAWFETITLEEPAKAELKISDTNITIDRKAYVCCYEPSSNRTFRGIVNIDAKKLESWNHVPGAQARIVTEEFSFGQELVRADTRFREACALRGITDLDKVLIETWAAGNFGVESEQGERIAYCYCWLINKAGDNRYGRPTVSYTHLTLPTICSV